MKLWKIFEGFEMNPTLELLRQIRSPFETDKILEDPKESKIIYQYAFKNRVGLLYLLSLKKTGCLDELTAEYEKLDFRARETLATTGRAGEVLNRSGIDYVIFKTIRPYAATPNDVDILCLDGESGYKKAINALYKAGYLTFDNGAPMQILFSDPRGRGIATWDKKGGIYYVDLYKAPATDFFVYLDPGKLKDHIIFTNLNGYPIKILRPEVELAAILMHSVFPETTFALEIFYTICFSLAYFTVEQIDRLVDFAEASHLTFPIRVCLSLSTFLHSQAFGYVPKVMSQTLSRVGGRYQREIDSFNAKGMKTPYKLLTTSFFLSFIKKLREPSSLKSLGIQGVHMLNPFFLKDVFLSLYNKVTKGTYHQV